MALFFFLQHPEFSFLLKERVCPLIIKLFSPSIKHRISSTPLEKPLYPVAVRLLRIVSVLIEKFYTLLVSCLISIFNFIDFFSVLKNSNGMIPWTWPTWTLLQLACTSRNAHRSDVFALIDVSSCLLEGCNIQQGT